jgi:asparagine synthase (glutamine-hydrolysing)
MSGAGAPAVMMSGGLDTAGVVAMMRRLQPGAQPTGIDSYSVIDDDPGSSLESQAIQAMASLPGITPHFAFVPSLRGIVSAEDLVEMAWARAHPVDNWLLIQGLMCLAASRDGKRVMLHGASGDITLRTPHRYPAVYLRQGRFLQAWRECRAASQNHVYLRGMSPRKTFAANAYAAFLPAAVKMRANRLRRRWRQRAGTSTLLSAEFTQRIQLEQRLEEQHRASERASVSELDAFHLETVQTMIMYAQSASGRVAARYAMELRDPWADRRVVEFFLGLPLKFKVRDGWTKYLVRTAFQQDLPAEVLWRTDKQHLGWKCTERLIAESRKYVDSLITDEIAVVQDYVDIDAARALYSRYLETSDAALRDTVFQLATLISWLKRVNSPDYQ